MRATVIGGGPAGSAAAIRLARRGYDVTLYEKSRFPRPKVCGGFVSPEALDDLDDLNVLEPLRHSGTVALRRTVIASKRGTVIESALEEEALSVSRDVLDSLLLTEATRAGVRVLEATPAPELIPDETLTVVATGRLSFLRQHESPTPWYASPRTPYFGIQALFANVNDVTDQVELDLIDSGYVGLARQTQGVNVSILTTDSAIGTNGPDLDRVLNYFMNENPMLQRHLAGANRLSPWLSVGPVRLGIRRLAHDQTFYVGDAACVVDPFAGEGMSMALYGSRLLLRSLEQTSDSPALEYERLWNEAFLPSLRWNALMRMLYSFSFFREPSLQLLGLFPQGMTILTDLTRYRKLELI